MFQSNVEAYKIKRVICFLVWWEYTIRYFYQFIDL